MKVSLNSSWHCCTRTLCFGPCPSWLSWLFHFSKCFSLPHEILSLWHGKLPIPPFTASYELLWWCTLLDPRTSQSKSRLPPHGSLTLSRVTLYKLRAALIVHEISIDFVTSFPRIPSVFWLVHGKEMWLAGRNLLASFQSFPSSCLHWELNDDASKSASLSCFQWLLAKHREGII